MSGFSIAQAKSTAGATENAGPAFFSGAHFVEGGHYIDMWVILINTAGSRGPRIRLFGVCAGPKMPRGWPIAEPAAAGRAPLGLARAGKENPRMKMGCGAQTARGRPRAGPPACPGPTGCQATPRPNSGGGQASRSTLCPI